jgi:hypothetical protein
MPNSGWDNGPGPAPSKGLSIWGKLAIGCGACLLCFILAIAALVGWGVRKAATTLDKGWAELHRDLDGLRSEAGARALYRANPGLVQTYPTEAEFLAAAAEWRPKLSEIPAQRPDLKALFTSGGFSMSARRSEGHKTNTLRLRLASGATLIVELEGEKLTDLRVD